MAKVLRSNWQLPVTAILLILGILLSVQFKTQQAVLTTLAAQSTENLAVMWSNLNIKKANLEAEIVFLNKENERLAQQSSNGSTINDLLRDADKLRLVTGTAPVSGPGITVTVTGDAPLIYLDLVDLVNELWGSGAEAIAINNVRLTVDTPITETREGNALFIIVGKEKLLFPCVIKAIGDADTLEKGLTFPGGLIHNLNNLYSIYPEIRQEKELSLPAAQDTPIWQYAKVKV